MPLSTLIVLSVRAFLRNAPPPDCVVSSPSVGSCVKGTTKVRSSAFEGVEPLLVGSRLLARARPDLASCSTRDLLLGGLTGMRVAGVRVDLLGELFLIVESLPGLAAGLMEGVV